MSGDRIVNIWVVDTRSCWCSISTSGMFRSWVLPPNSLTSDQVTWIFLTIKRWLVNLTFITKWSSMMMPCVLLNMYQCIMYVSTYCHCPRHFHESLLACPLRGQQSSVQRWPSLHCVWCHEVGMSEWGLCWVTSPVWQPRCWSAWHVSSLEAPCHSLSLSPLAGPL